VEKLSTLSTIHLKGFVAKLKKLSTTYVDKARKYKLLTLLLYQICDGFSIANRNKKKVGYLLIKIFYPPWMNTDLHG